MHGSASKSVGKPWGAAGFGGEGYSQRGVSWWVDGLGQMPTCVCRICGQDDAKQCVGALKSPEVDGAEKFTKACSCGKRGSGAAICVGVLCLHGSLRSWVWVLRTLGMEWMED